MKIPLSNKTIEGALSAKTWLEEHPDKILELRHILSSYYKEHGRDFPWRRTTDPYKILIAEMLLQKTSVKPVVRVWTAFIYRYPTVEALANTSVEEIQAIISTLGLQKRAKSLHKVAQRIIEETGGKFIGNANFLESLPGIGNYTASAILSFALNVFATTIDVNAGRVYTRICGFSPNTLRQSLAFAHIVSREVATQETHREVNYGTLDLAAQVCKQKPLCMKCPACAICQFSQSNVATTTDWN